MTTSHSPGRVHTPDLSVHDLRQLWNVSRGEMSSVGPWPLTEAEDRHVNAWARARLDSHPRWQASQVRGRTTIPFEEMVTLSYLYVTKMLLFGGRAADPENATGGSG